MYRQDIYFTIRKFITENKLIIPGQKVICSVSGGPDSLCMLLALDFLRKEIGFFISIFHLDHMLRMDESKEDAAFVAEVANKLGVDIYLRECDIHKIAEQKKESIELAARRERINNLLALARELEADRISTGHTLSDHAETVLYRMIRGCGLKGLSAMQPVSGMFIKPLLCIYREDSERFCHELGYEYRIDRTNLDISSDRNKIRNSVIPFINGLFNRDIRKPLVRLAELAEEDNEALESISDTEFNRIIVKDDCGIRILKTDLIMLNSAVLKRVLRRALKYIKGDSVDIDEGTIRNMLKILNDSTGYRSVDIGSGIKIESEYEWIIFPKISSHKISDTSDKYTEKYLVVPGEFEINEISFIFKTKIFEKREENISKDEYIADMDLSVIKGKIKVRSWHEGDRMIPLGMVFEKKVHDIFIDKKIPFQKRKHLPILCDEEKIIWIPGVKMDNRVKIQDNTTKILRIEAIRKNIDRK